MRYKATLISLLVFVSLALVVAPTVASCVAANNPCCCGAHAKPSDPCPARCTLESPDPTPQTTPEPIRTVQTQFVVVAQLGDLQLPTPVSSPLPTISGTADDFPNDSLLSYADATRAPPLSV